MATSKQVRKELFKRIESAEKVYTNQVLLYNTLRAYLEEKMSFDNFFSIIEPIGECPPECILWCESVSGSPICCCDKCDLVRNDNITDMNCKECWKRSLEKIKKD